MPKDADQFDEQAKSTEDILALHREFTRLFHEGTKGNQDAYTEAAALRKQLEGREWVPKEVALARVKELQEAALDPLETRSGRAITGMVILSFVGFVLFKLNGALIGALLGAAIGYLWKPKRASSLIAICAIVAWIVVQSIVSDQWVPSLIATIVGVAWLFQLEYGFIGKAAHFLYATFYLTERQRKK